MKRSIVAAVALLAGMAIAAPMLASAADDETQVAQAGPSQQDMGGMPGMMGDMPASREHQGMGPMGHPGWMGAMRHRLMQLTPRQRCEERLARRAGSSPTRSPS